MLSNHIPTELLRTAVTVSETGSLSKAATRLRLSQPAVSAQIKRLHNLVGGVLFDSTPNGTSLTELGKLVVQQAKRALNANDQIVMLGGGEPAQLKVRLGLSSIFARDFYARAAASTIPNLSIQIDKSAQLASGLLDGYIDIACIYEKRNVASQLLRYVVNEASEPLVWIRSPNLSLTPGQPLPIVAWTGDEWTLHALDRARIPYRITTRTPDHHVQLMAVEAGIGVSGVPGSRVPTSVKIADESFLPLLPRIRSLLCVREDVPTRGAVALLRELSEIFFNQSSL